MEPVKQEHYVLHTLYPIFSGNMMLFGRGKDMTSTSVKEYQNSKDDDDPTGYIIELLNVHKPL